MKKGFFSIFKGRDDQFYFNLKAANNEIILRSEGYHSKDGAINGVTSVQNHCENDDNYQRKKAKNNKPYFVLKARNNEIIGVSQLYKTDESVEVGIRSVMVNGVSKILKGTDESLYEVSINNITYDVKPGDYKGSEILKIAGFIGPRFCLFLINDRNRTEIKQNETFTIKNCLEFSVIRND